MFQELNGKEFIYKEKKLVRLGEITERLTVSDFHLTHVQFWHSDSQKIFTTKFGKGFQLINHSRTVDPNTLDPNIAYLQITSVNPYFESWEKNERVTVYEQNSTLNQFIFFTPFTRSGKNQASDIKSQYLRKTILTVENHFPHIKKRLLVISKKEVNEKSLDIEIYSRNKF